MLQVSVSHPMTYVLQTISVPFEYPVYFTRAVLDPSNPCLIEALSRREPSRRHRVLAVIDAGVAAAWPSIVDDLARYAEAHGDRMALVDRPLVTEGGEASKNDPSLPTELYARFRTAGMDRQSFVLIVGGGALLDVVGYAAATAHRGLRVVRLPTTVLSQADSGVGVKNGVNLYGNKNFVGTFAPPFAVLNDLAFLDTLSARDRRAGTAEAVKVALVRDASFFAWLDEHAESIARGDRDALERLVRRSAELHLEHIRCGGDPFEMGSARPLDFGHWAAHKLESLSDHRVRHGEGVAIGMALDVLYSRRAGLLDDELARRILGLLRRLGFDLWDDALTVENGVPGRPLLLDGLAEFREHLGGELTITLLGGVGRGVEVNTIDDEMMRRSLRDLRDVGRA